MGLMSHHSEVLLTAPQSYHTDMRYEINLLHSVNVVNFLIINYKIIH